MHSDFTHRDNALTPRESEVLAEIMNGAERKQIAKSLACSEMTVVRHINSILEKTGMDSTRQLMAHLYQRKIGELKGVIAHHKSQNAASRAI